MLRLITACLYAASVFGQQADKLPALEGLDPVLLAQGKEEPGKAEFTATHGRLRYVFTSNATKEQFLKDPERWSIQLEGACARMGDPVQGSPDSYYVHEGRIYTFGSPACYRLFKENPTKYLALPVQWNPKKEDLQKGAALLTEIRTSLGLAKMSGWIEKRTSGPTQRTLTAKFPFSIEAEATNPRFSFRESLTRDKVEQTVQDRLIVKEGAAARATRAGYSRDFLWLISGSLEAVPEAAGGVGVYTGAEIVTIELKDKRPVSARWKGRGLDGAVAELRIVYDDYRQAEGGGLIPFRGEVFVDGQAAPQLSWVIESCSIQKQTTAWNQWGGPNRDFHVIADIHAWPASGPKRIWSRKIGDGYSAIVSDGSKLYTMYREAEQEVVLAASAATGETIWEYRYNAPLFAGFEPEQGAGPRATPLLDGDLLFTAGATGLIQCLRRDSGTVAWSIDLQKAFGAKIRARGYSVSPLSWKDTVIIMAGGSGAGIVSLCKKDGSVVWKARDEETAYASPFVIQVEGKPVLLAMMARELLGLDPDTGALRWSHPHSNSELVNASTPVAGEDGIVILSSAYDGGCRALQLKADGVKELWSHRLLRIHHSNGVRIGDTVYGSSGDFGPSPLTAVDAKTGKVLWRDRNFGKSSMLVANGKLLLLDEDGALLLAAPGAEAPQLLAKTQLMQGLSWTVPSLSDGTLYVRNRSEMAAYSLP